MSLIDEFMTPCVLMEKTRTSDGEGGFISTYTESLQFNAAIVYNNGTLAKIAEKQGVTGNYTVTTLKNVTLDFHDVFKRVSDGKYFRVVTDAGEKKSPDSSTLNISQVNAEEWEMTS